jgi:hypothetical protein|tara:strand:- start:217 stop:672 length:456 start_codon:yes stop_codon:yes gene_type:complete
MWIGAAAVLGALFTLTHAITITITCAVVGFNWGTTAWCLDLSGYVAGALFAVLCWKSSNSISTVFRKNNGWICMWATITVVVRIVDTLMLFGVLKLDEVYVTPTGAVLISNIVSEVLIGNAYVVAALTGSLLLLFYPEDADTGYEIPSSME